MMQRPRTPEVLAQIAQAIFEGYAAFFSRSNLPSEDHTNSVHTPVLGVVNVRGLSQHRMEQEVERRGSLGPRIQLFWQHIWERVLKILYSNMAFLVFMKIYLSS